ncbi:MAG: TetR/AcrR family transcriptional regulator [Rhodospirillaceae bacterium]|nr:MAG: TetR/AcrR family transcriptional regulator [Rhodospirillaceae bacterium]
MANDDETGPCTPKRGRPLRGTEDARRRALLKAAEELFMDQGFGNSSMDAVAKRAGVSKKTIYCFVANKEELFEAVMKDHIERSPLPALEQDIADAETLERTLARNLAEVARVRLVPFAVNAFRLTIAEAPRFPEIARTFYREAPARHIQMLADWLRTQVDHGLIALDDPTDAATILSSAMVLEPLRTAALGVGPLPSQAVIEVRAKTLARLFLNGCLAKRD